MTCNNNHKKDWECFKCGEWMCNDCLDIKIINDNILIGSCPICGQKLYEYNKETDEYEVKYEDIATAYKRRHKQRRYRKFIDKREKKGYYCEKCKKDYNYRTYHNDPCMQKALYGRNPL